MGFLFSETGNVLKYSIKLDFVEVETVDFDTTLSDKNNLSNLSLLPCWGFDNINIIYKEIYYVNVEMELLLIFEIIINHYHYDHCYYYHNYLFIYNWQNV